MFDTLILFVFSLTSHVEAKEQKETTEEKLKIKSRIDISF